MKSASMESVMDIQAILDVLPHRYPILLVDRIEEMDPGVSATGIKAVTMNEPFFQGHFPGNPVMPGVLIIEALAQTAAAQAIYAQGKKAEDVLVYFLAIDSAKFRKPVMPGCLLKLHVRMEKQRGNVQIYSCKACCDDQVMTEVRFTAMVVDRES